MNVGESGLPTMYYRAPGKFLSDSGRYFWTSEIVAMRPAPKTSKTDA
jgi:hypothetical protein